MPHPIEQATNTILGTAAATSVFGMISQDNLVSIGAVVMTLGGLLLKLASDFRAKRRADATADRKAELDADMEELAARRKADLDGIAAWKQMITTSAEEAGAALGKLKAVEDRALAAEARALELEKKVKALTVSQNDVITAVNKQRDRVKNAESRVGELENAVGSTSDLNLKPAHDDGTSLDMPAMG